MISPGVSAEASEAGPQQKVIDLPVGLPAVVAASIASSDFMPRSYAAALPVRALPILLGHLLL